MARHVRKGDLVIVTKGAARGKQGKVLSVNPKRDHAIVEGLNVRKKHVRPNQANPQGGIVEKEMPIHLSNISPMVEGKPTRVRFESRDDGSKVRVAVRSKETLGPPIRGAKK